MAISHGDKFSLSKLADLVVAANASAISKGVVPMTYNTDAPGSPPWGHRIVDHVQITNRGSGFKVGEMVSLGWETSYAIGVVDDSGGILLLRTISKGFGWYGDTIPTSLSFTGGSGSGATAEVAILQYGPYVDYDFSQSGAEFNPLRGEINNFWLINGGKNYNPGDTLNISVLPGATLVVDTVNAGGRILTWHKSASASHLIVPTNFTDMAAHGGTGEGASFGGYPILDPRPTWLTELNRMRTHLEEYIDGDLLSSGRIISPEKLCCSGPWPCSGITDNFADTNFYYEDNGVTESVTLACDLPSLSCSKFEIALVDLNVPYFPVQIYGTHMEFSILVGGSSPLAVNGSFTFSGIISQGYTYTYDNDGNLISQTPDGVDPVSLITISGTFPGTQTITNSGGSVSIKFDINASLDPGIYTLILDVAAPADGTYSYTQVLQTHTGVNFLTGYGGSTAQTGNSSLTASAAVDTPGIHNSKAVKKIKIPGDPNSLGPFVYFVDYFCTNAVGGNTIWLTSPYPQPTFDTTPIYKKFVPYLTVSCPGFWSAKTPMLSDPNFVTPADMPWNLPRTKVVGSYTASVNPVLLGNLAPNDASGNPQVSNSYDQAVPVEYQRELPAWKASTYFTTGFNIQASDGNVWRCVRPGLSLATVPNWGSPNLVDSTGVYLYESSPTSGLMWERVYSPDPAIAQSTHREQCIPVWPIYWAFETEDYNKPPTSTSGLTRWGAYNQWILNNQDGAVNEPSWQQYGLTRDMLYGDGPADTHGLMCGAFIVSISVDKIRGFPSADFGSYTTVYDVVIGCMRGGVFVEFGHFPTGNTYQVLWPVFTTDALVYNCAQRVQVQALAIKNPGVSSGLLSAAAFPAMAAFINDTKAVIDLLP